MTTSPDDPLVWDVRLFVYQFFTDHERPPTIAEAAAQFAIPVERAERIYQALNARHALFLEPGQRWIRIANPFSGVPTSFVVSANQHRYYANCAGTPWAFQRCSTPTPRSRRTTATRWNR